MTQDIYEVITQDLLEHRIRRSRHEPLPLSDLIAQTQIVPLGVRLHEQLEELEVHLTLNYLSYYIDGVYSTTTSTMAKNLYLCYGGSNILKVSEYTRPVLLGVWRIRLGRQDSKSKDKR